jgi:hypothetical protein
MQLLSDFSSLSTLILGLISADMLMHLAPWLESLGRLFCAGCLFISGGVGSAMLRGTGATLRRLFTGMWIAKWASRYLLGSPEMAYEPGIMSYNVQ